MKAPADKSPEPQRQATTHVAPQQQDRSDAEVQFIDNREETASLRQLQEVADNSSRTQGLSQLNAMMNNSLRSGAMQSLQAKVDTSPRQVAQRQLRSGIQGVTIGAGSDNLSVQRVEDEEVLQGEFDAESPAQLAQPPEDKPNNTGLPDNLKAGVESLSGMSLDNVKVHYNSSKPAQLNAHAYAQGTDIHVGPGQEQHLPHEAWHVVQQAQGRVKPTVQMKTGIAINDDARLEKEADVMGAAAMKANENEEKIYPLSTASHIQIPMLQGYFRKGYTSIPPGSLIGTFVELKETWSKIIALLEDDFYKMVSSDKDEGGFDTWLESKLILTEEREAILKKVRADGAGEGNFRKAMREVGKIGFDSMPKESMLAKTEVVKLAELKEDPRTFEAPPSPRAESRLIQIPRLVGLIQSCFNGDKLLSEFEFILGGGSAMSLKRPIGGRLGRASENMRDIDMDFQFKEGQAPVVKKLLDELKVTTMKDMMEEIMGRMDAALKNMPKGLHDQLKTEDMRISGRNTIMFNAGDLEYSFHFVNEAEENELRLKSIEAPIGLDSIKIIDDESHWILTKSALRARLKRPDKIHKTLIDACIFIGSPESDTYARRLLETVAIIFGGLRKITTARNTLRRLAGPDVMGVGEEADKVLFKGQPISGLDPRLAAEWQKFLLGRSDKLYDRNKNEYINLQEIQIVRLDYFKVFEAILFSIMNKAGGDRPFVGNNAHSIYQGFLARYKDAYAKGVLHISNIKPKYQFAEDEELSNPLSGTKRPELEHRNVIGLPSGE